ncbi:MAG: TfoX family protein [Dehalococcoidia bacterium]|nr:TfoX family protein [Dehalococcoidia bacterium]
MPYDQTLADRVRGALSEKAGITERKMFGGLCLMHWGNMVCGIVGNKLMLRVGPDRYDDAMAQPHAAPMDFTGRPLKGMVYVLPEGMRTDEALGRWVDRALRFSGSLPRKGL